jgi:hypothetical protein
LLIYIPLIMSLFTVQIHISYCAKAKTNILP